MASASTDLVRSVLAEGGGGGLFASALWHLQSLYPVAYDRAFTSAFGPSRPDYEVVMEVEAGSHTDNIPLGWAPKRR